MLSKSQARAFFLGGTALFSIIFLILTFDMHRQAVARTNEQFLSESVNRGKMIWEKNNCMGCHTILGEGAYYAPDLTLSYKNRGEQWLRIFLKDPQAMYPGERKMVQYHFTDDEMTDVIAFLKWVGEIDTNGWPPEPNIKPVSSASKDQQTTAVARPEVVTNLCIPCHSIAGTGGNVGPALDGVANRFEVEYLEKWLVNPAALKPGTNMPKLPLSDNDVQVIVNYLQELK